VGEDRAALPGQGDGCRPQRQGQPVVFGGGAVDSTRWGAVAGSPRTVRQLELDIHTFPTMVAKKVFEGLFAKLSGDPDFEYAMVDGTIIRVHQHGTGAKGGLKVRPSDARAAA